MDIIRESLSNFAEVSKNFTNFASARKTDNEDETIEEDVEEEIPEDNDESNSSNEDHKFEVIKKEQSIASKQTTRKGRPVSAVYDLSKFKTGSQQPGG